MIGGVLLELGKSMWAISFINGAVEDKKTLQVFTIIAYLPILFFTVYSVHIDFFCINLILSRSAIEAKIYDTKLA